MDDEFRDDHHEPDITAAHYTAWHKLETDDKALGILNCTDYLIEYHHELDDASPVISPELLHALDAMPRLGNHTAEAQLVAEAFTRSYLAIPTGLYDLPVNWGYAIRRVMLETHWPEFENCTIKDVFGWSYVSRFGAHLHIQFAEPLSPKSASWSDIGSFILELHQRFEPGPYTPLARLCEFA